MAWIIVGLLVVGYLVLYFREDSRMRKRQERELEITLRARTIGDAVNVMMHEFLKVARVKDPGIRIFMEAKDEVHMEISSLVNPLPECELFLVND